MEELVHSYLNKNYILENDILGEIKELNVFDRTIKEYKYCLLDELVTVFGLSKDEAKIHADSWAYKTNPKASLIFYWGFSAIKPKSRFTSPGVFVMEHDISHAQAPPAVPAAMFTKPAKPTSIYIMGIDVANVANSELVEG